MKKEEILAKSRNENKNGGEFEKKILSNAIKFSYAAMISATALFAFVRAARGYPMMDLPAVCCISVFANFIYRYVKTREKSDLIIAIITLIIAVIAAVGFFMGH